MPRFVAKEEGTMPMKGMPMMGGKAPIRGRANAAGRPEVAAAKGKKRKKKPAKKKGFIARY